MFCDEENYQDDRDEKQLPLRSIIPRQEMRQAGKVHQVPEWQNSPNVIGWNHFYLWILFRCLSYYPQNRWSLTSDRLR
jgi:hypothetical protein